LAQNGFAAHQAEEREKSPKQHANHSDLKLDRKSLILYMGAKFHPWMIRRRRGRD
jgi:hypothetical protein